MSSSRRRLDDAALLEQITKVRSVDELAPRRITAGLAGAAPPGVRVGRRRVERVVREHRLQGATCRPDS